MQEIYTIKQNIDSLSFQLKSIAATSNIYNEPFKNKFAHENYQYNLAEVIAKIIIKVHFVDEKIAVFQSIINEYNIKNQTSLSYDYFINNCWVREILGEIVIPCMVKDSLFGQEKLIHERDYYNCLKDYYIKYKEAKHIINKQDIAYIISGFGRNSLSIDLLLTLNIVRSIDNSDDFEFCTKYNAYLRCLSNEVFTYIAIETSAHVSLSLMLKAGMTNFNKLQDMLLVSNLNNLHSEALRVLSLENDVNNSDSEITKVMFDAPRYEHQRPPKTLNLDFSSLSNLVISIDKIRSGISDIFWRQPSRVRYYTLLDFMLCTATYDFNFSTGTCTYQTILDILNEFEKKPYMAYTVFNLIKEKYPFLAPYLLINKNTSCIGLDVVENMNVNQLIYDTEGRDLKKEMYIKGSLWIKMFDFILDQLDISQVNDDIYCYDHISEILINLANKIFNQMPIFGNDGNYRCEYFLKTYNSAINIISSKKFYTNSYISSTSHQMIDSLLPMLFRTANENLKKEYEYIENGFLSLSRGSVYHAVEVIKLSHNLTNDNALYDEIIQGKNILITTFYGILIYFYTTDSVKFRYYHSPEEHEQTPKRQAKQNGFELIDWGSIYIEFMRNGLLENINNKVFESISITDAEDGIYERNNQEELHKMTLYLKSLMIAYININDDINHFINLLPDIYSELKKLARLIKECALRFSITDLKNQRIDIFKENPVINNYGLYHQSLKSLLYKCVNLFESDFAYNFINDFFDNSSNLSMMLNAANSINNKRILDLIELKINNSDIDAYLNSINWVPEVTQALIDAVNSNTYYKTHAKRLFEIVNEHYNKINTIYATNRHVISQNANIPGLLYEISLLLAFKQNNQSEFNKINPPKDEQHKNTQQNNNLKLFYALLFDIHHNKIYDAAIPKLRQLQKDNPNVPKFAIELFFACTLQAVKTNALDKTLLSNANRDFSHYKISNKNNNDLTEALNQYDNYIKYHEIYYYIADFNTDDFDIIFSNLSEEFKFDSRLTPHVYSFYLMRDLNELAISYLDSAYQYIYDNYPEEVDQIATLVAVSSRDPKNLKKIKLSLEKLYSLPAVSIPSVIPDRINDKKTLNMFILNEFIEAAKVMLNKIKSIKYIRSENKYNDLLLAILKLRFDVFGWTISDQNRSGSSVSGIDAGSIDLIIESGSHRVTLAEALIHKDKSYTQEHVLKCFNYDKNLKRFYMVIYSHNKNFDLTWENYKKYLSKAKFNPSVSLLNNDVNCGFIDLNAEFSDILSMKVAKTQHGNDVEMYHLMINLPDA